MKQALAKPPTVQHERLTPEQIKFFWQQGDYSPHGYLFHLLRALRKDGWWLRIVNVAEFCREWDIDRRTFYRAKAKLIEDNRVQEHLTQVDLRIVSNEHTCDISGTVSQISHTCDISGTVSQISHTDPPETLTLPESCNSTDLIQIYTDLSQRERELTRAREEEPEPVAVDPPLRSQVAEESLASPNWIGEDQSSAPPLNEQNFEGFDFEHFQPDSNLNYWEWAYGKCADLKRFREAAKHPNPIGDVAAYALGCIKKRGVAGFKAYLIEIGVLPPEISQMAAVTETRASQRAAPDAWQKSNSNLQVVCERDGVDGVIDRLKLLLAGTNTPSDPDRVRWLIEQNPQWRLQLRDGRVERIDQPDRADCSDYTALIPAYIQRLQLTKENLEVLLEERYGVRRRSALDEAQLKDFALFLADWTGGASCAS